MRSKIHYEDDLFFLNLQMKLLREGFQLNIDADYFLDKILSDLRFLDASLGKIFATLKENPNLIRRAEYFHNLIKVQTVFSELLEDIVSQKFPFCEFLAPFFAEFKQRLSAHRSDTLEIRSTLKSISQEDEEKDDVITPDELTLLMQPDPEEEE